MYIHSRDFSSTCLNEKVNISSRDLKLRAFHEYLEERTQSILCSSISKDNCTGLKIKYG